MSGGSLLPQTSKNSQKRPFRRFAGAVRRRENLLLFSIGLPLIFLLLGATAILGGGQVGARLLPHLPSGLAQPQALDLGISVL